MMKDRRSKWDGSGAGGRWGRADDGRTDGGSNELHVDTHVEDSQLALSFQTTTRRTATWKRTKWTWRCSLLQLQLLYHTMVGIPHSNSLTPTPVQSISSRVINNQYHYQL